MYVSLMDACERIVVSLMDAAKEFLCIINALLT